MLKRKALMESISSDLNGFLKKIVHNLSVPDKKFLHNCLIDLSAVANLSSTRWHGTYPTRKQNSYHS